VIQVKGSNNVFFQWLGNHPTTQAHKQYALGWVSKGDNKGYYRAKPTHHSHMPWTNEDTSTDMRVSDILFHAPNILGPDNRMANNVKRILEQALDETIRWA
jgi:hypothetical protein